MKIKIILVFLLHAFICITGFSQVNFIDSDQKLGNSCSNSVALADIDNDGDLDAIVANSLYNESQQNEIWINDGKGYFKPGIQGLNYGKNLGVSLADLDGNGTLDIYLCVGSGEPDKVFFNDGLGNFTDSGQILGNANSNIAGLADFDGDGDIDAFVCVHPLYDGTQSYDFGNEVWLNNGKGIFEDTGVKLGDGNYSDLSIADIDGDGDVDAATPSNYRNAGNKIFINDGKGKFVESSGIISALNSRDIAFGDLDNDNDSDAFVIYSDVSSDFNNGIWYNDGKGNFTESAQKFGITPGIAVCLDDIDNDGDLDAFVSGGKYLKKEISKIWLNNGYGIFTDSLVIGYDESNDVKLGDLDGDGDLDAFIANNGPNKVFFNTINDTILSINNNKVDILKIYPNPAQHTLQIEYPGLICKNINYKITDLSGKTVQEGKLVWNTINVSKLGKGNYLLNLNIEGGVVSKKFIIK